MPAPGQRQQGVSASTWTRAQAVAVPAPRAAASRAAKEDGAPKRSRDARHRPYAHATHEHVHTSNNCTRCCGHNRALVGIAAASIADVEDVVTVPQFRVLVMLYTRGPMNMAAVATALDVNPSNARRTCDRLMKAGLLDRRESADDRRNVTLTITEEGRRNR